jgi:hypothetical protein
MISANIFWGNQLPSIFLVEHKTNWQYNPHAHHFIFNIIYTSKKTTSGMIGNSGAANT